MPRKIIAVITARADDSEQRALISGIADMAFSLDCDVAVFSNVYNHWVTDEFLNFENHIYDFFSPELFCGVIVTAEAFLDLSILDDVFVKIRESGIPAVLIGGKADGFVSVDSDDEANMEKITEHLITAHGIRKFHILTGPPDMAVSPVRVRGCMNSFKKHNIPFDESCIFYGDFWNTSGEALAQRYLSGELEMPEAVICTNDYTAYGLCDVLTSAGVPIPEKLAVTGYDHTDGRIFYYPVLTTYRRNRYQMGENAVRIIMQKEYSDICSEDGLMCGNSCGCRVNSAQLNDDTRTARIGQFHTAMNSSAQFANRLTLSRTLSEYMAVLNEFFYLLHGATTLYLCLDKEWNNTYYEGEEFICCKAYYNSTPELPVHFKRNQLLPILFEERDRPVVFCFSPLCFQTRLFGYTALMYAIPQCYDFSFRDWNKTVANSLEFLRMKNDIQYLTQCRRVSTLYDSLTGFYHMREFRQIIETLGTEFSGECFLQAVKLSFSDDGEFIYGENFRSDIISSSAGAIKDSFGNKAVYCRGGDDLFLVLCRGENTHLLSEKLKIMLYFALNGKFDENRVFVTYAEVQGKADSDTADALCRKVNQLAEENAQLLQEQKKLPHYKSLLAVRNRMQSQPEKAPTTEEVCRALCMSDGYFRVSYKKCFGTSYVQDCINARIKKSCYLLCTTAMSVYAIALKCGYTDEKYFSRQFRQTTGCSPVQYRERYC